MKTKIKNVYNKNRYWFNNFSSAFCGTVLGILITIGTSAYMNYRSQIEMNNKIRTFTTNNIERKITDLKSELEDISETKKMLDYINKFYPNNYNKIPNDSISLAIGCLSTFGISGLDNSTENIFSSNIDIWKNSENEKIIMYIGDCFALISSANKYIEEVKKTRHNFFRKYATTNNLTNVETAQEAIRLLFEMPEYTTLVVEYGIHETILNNSIEIIEQLHDKCKNIQINKDIEDVDDFKLDD